MIDNTQTWVRALKPETFGGFETYDAVRARGVMPIREVIMERLWWVQATPSTLMEVTVVDHGVVAAKGEEEIHVVPAWKCTACGVVIFCSEYGQLTHDCDEIRDYRVAVHVEKMQATYGAPPPARARTEADLWR